MMETRKKIIFSGGGSGGPVTPLLVLAAELQNDYDLLFVGTKTGPEKELIENDGFKFISISSGKLRRYFSWQNFTDIFKIAQGFFDSWKLLSQDRPNLIISAGAFVSVPLVLAAYLRRIPVIVHQQDIRAGLANKLMAPLARVVTVTFERSLRSYNQRAKWIGNPFVEIDHNNRVDILFKLTHEYNLESDLPLVLVVGGGTGAVAINNILQASLDDLCEFCQILHISGKDKMISANNSRYHQFELVAHAELLEFEMAADLVVSRCGLGFLTELSALAKPSILIPMPHSHQEENAAIFECADAARVLSETELNAKIFVSEIRKIINNKDLQATYRQNISQVMKPGATTAMVEIIKKTIDSGSSSE